MTKPLTDKQKKTLRDLQAQERAWQREEKGFWNIVDNRKEEVLEHLQSASESPENGLSIAVKEWGNRCHFPADELTERTKTALHQASRLYMIAKNVGVSPDRLLQMMSDGKVQESFKRMAGNDRSE